MSAIDMQPIEDEAWYEAPVARIDSL